MEVCNSDSGIVDKEEDTSTTSEITVTIQAAVFPPSIVITITTAIPGALAVTTPSLESSSIAGLLILQVIFLLMVFCRVIMAVSQTTLPYL